MIQKSPFVILSEKCCSEESRTDAASASARIALAEREGRKVRDNDFSPRILRDAPRTRVEHASKVLRYAQDATKNEPPLMIQKTPVSF